MNKNQAHRRHLSVVLACCRVDATRWWWFVVGVHASTLVVVVVVVAAGVNAPRQVVQQQCPLQQRTDRANR